MQQDDAALQRHVQICLKEGGPQLAPGPGESGAVGAKTFGSCCDGQMLATSASPELNSSQVSVDPGRVESGLQ